MVARVLFLLLTSCGNTTTPHPAGDHKGPPSPSSPLSPLRIRLMHGWASVHQRKDKIEFRPHRITPCM